MTTPASTASRPLITKHPASPLPFLTGADPKTRIIIFSVVVAAVLAFITVGFLIFLMVAYNFNILQWIE